MILIPKYRNPSIVVVNGVLSMGLCLSSSLRNINTDLELLIVYPENDPKLSIKVIRSGILVFRLVRKNIISSAYKDMQCSLPPIVMPDIPTCVLTAIARGSIASMKSNGDRGHPCRVDLHKLKGFEILLLVRTSAVGFVYSSRIHLRKVPPSPNLGSNSKR